MVEIQYEEYGSGDASSMHSVLFGKTMNALGLDSSCGSYVEVLPGATLATVNLVSMFALHQRWRAALVGHLAVFEMTSVEPMGRYSNALARFGIGPEGRRFYDVHVIVDERYALIARDRMVAGLIRAGIGSGLAFWSCGHLDARTTIRDASSRRVGGQPFISCSMAVERKLRSPAGCCW
jgi:hypothetical protein